MVFLAIDTRLRREVAIEFVCGNNADHVRRLISEARNQARVSHEREPFTEARRFSEAVESFEPTLRYSALAPRHEDHAIRSGEPCRAWAMFERARRAGAARKSGARAGPARRRGHRAAHAGTDCRAGFADALRIQPTLGKAWHRQAALAQQLAATR